MALTTGSYIIGNHLLFCPKGTTLASGVSSVSNKPVVTTDDATYISLPCVDSADFTSTSQDKKVFCPNPGARVLTKIFSTDFEANWKFTLKELSSALYRFVFGVEDLAAASPYTPFAVARREGWFRVTQYDDENNLLFTHDFFGSMKLDGTVSFNNDVVTVSAMVDVNMQAANTIKEE